MLSTGDTTGAIAQLRESVSCSRSLRVNGSVLKFAQFALKQLIRQSVHAVISLR